MNKKYNPLNNLVKSASEANEDWTASDYSKLMGGLGLAIGAPSGAGLGILHEGTKLSPTTRGILGATLGGGVMTALGINAGPHMETLDRIHSGKWKPQDYYKKSFVEGMPLSHEYKEEPSSFNRVSPSADSANVLGATGLGLGASVGAIMGAGESGWDLPVYKKAPIAAAAMGATLGGLGYLAGKFIPHTGGGSDSPRNKVLGSFEYAEDEDLKGVNDYFKNKGVNANIIPTVALYNEHINNPKAHAHMDKIEGIIGREFDKHPQGYAGIVKDTAKQFGITEQQVQEHPKYTYVHLLDKGLSKGTNKQAGILGRMFLGEPPDMHDKVWEEKTSVDWDKSPKEKGLARIMNGNTLPKEGLRQINNDLIKRYGMYIPHPDEMMKEKDPVKSENAFRRTAFNEALLEEGYHDHPDGYAGVINEATNWFNHQGYIPRQVAPEEVHKNPAIAYTYLTARGMDNMVNNYFGGKIPYDKINARFGELPEEYRQPSTNKQAALSVGAEWDTPKSKEMVKQVDKFDKHRQLLKKIIGGSLATGATAGMGLLHVISHL